MSQPRTSPWNRPRSHELSAFHFLRNSSAISPRCSHASFILSTQPINMALMAPRLFLADSTMLRSRSTSW